MGIPGRPKPAVQPGSGGLGVGECLLGGKTLGDHNHKGFGRVQTGEGEGEVGRVDIGDEAEVNLGR